jgi:creatinine amidohydrolase/Fe(II)-dependent formamide hydrolase-like protein
VLGDPRRATAAHGRTLLTKLSIDLVAAVDAWWE